MERELPEFCDQSQIDDISSSSSDFTPEMPTEGTNYYKALWS
jgi:hypothetical protein